MLQGRSKRPKAFSEGRRMRCFRGGEGCLAAPSEICSAGVAVRCREQAGPLGGQLAAASTWLLAGLSLEPDLPAEP